MGLTRQALPWTVTETCWEKVMKPWIRLIVVALGVLATVSVVAQTQAPRADISLDTPSIRAIQARMETRFDTRLRAFFDQGALGFTSDAFVQVRNASLVPIAQRPQLNAWVEEDNRDRRAVYREVAVANGHPEWEAQIRATFARQWIESARAGWWYQSQDGAWRQK